MPKKRSRVENLNEIKREISWEKAVSNFLTWKRAEGRAERTLKDYSYHLARFQKLYPDVQLTNDDNLREKLWDYMADDVKPAYYNNKLVYLRTFLNWLVEEGFLTDNPLKKLKKRKADDRIVRLDADTLKQLLALPDQKTYSGLRDYALLLFQIDTGVRPKEALTLLVSDLNLKAYEIRIQAEHAKTRISRTLPISSITAKAIHKLIHVRPTDWDDSVTVFCTYEGNDMSVDSWYKRVSFYGSQLGQTIYPYQLRHTFAIEFLRNGGNAFALQKAMGHSDMNMTKKYIALADSDLKEQHLLASPISNLVQEKKRIKKI
ncbi:tyrosine-type recombinase/integrase [Heliorestis convoluta]|uniref:Tyrosine-type recombinase/integrase n=1 Tax=Heliorestis convoluta TaxID=356322 RepID=A0A5Q2MYA7_9FIRM|nr:tyrosine-type recombinase/integrase [Heliorestis convoluta]QGG46373.1 tyrosine-type recombinase/integrase [Heliorestis convoluta]